MEIHPNKSFLLSVALLLLLPLQSFAENPTGEMLSFGCTGCHGTEGNSQSDIPELTGMTKMKLAEQLIEFRTGKKEATIMQRIAKGYTDAEIELLADYFSRQGKGGRDGN